MGQTNSLVQRSNRALVPTGPMWLVPRFILLSLRRIRCRLVGVGWHICRVHRVIAYRVVSLSGFF